MNAVMVRTLGLSAAEACAAPNTRKKVPSRTASAINCETDTDQPLLRNIRVSLRVLHTFHCYVDGRSRALGPSKIRRNAGNAFSNDQAMDVMRALVGVNGFEVVHMPHDAVIVYDSVGAQNVASFARSFHGHPYI